MSLCLALGFLVECVSGAAVQPGFGHVIVEATECLDPWTELCGGEAAGDNSAPKAAPHFQRREKSSDWHHILPSSPSPV